MSNFLIDPFNGTGGNPLAGTTAPTGSTWSQLTGNTDFVLAGDAVYGVGLAYNDQTPPSADYKVEVIARFVGATSEYVMATGRVVGTDSRRYEWRLYGDGNYYLFVFDAGSNPTQLATGSMSVSIGVDYTIVLDMSGQTIKGFVDSVEKVSVTNSGVTVAGHAGVGSNGSSGNAQAKGIRAGDLLADANINAINNIATTSLSAINGITKASISHVNGLTI